MTGGILTEASLTHTHTHTHAHTPCRPSAPAHHAADCCVSLPGEELGPSCGVRGPSDRRLRCRRGCADTGRVLAECMCVSLLCPSSLLSIHMSLSLSSLIPLLAPHASVSPSCCLVVSVSLPLSPFLLFSLPGEELGPSCGVRGPSDRRLRGRGGYTDKGRVHSKCTCLVSRCAGVSVSLPNFRVC